MRREFLPLLLLPALAAAPFIEQPLQRAMHDEVERTRKELKLGDYPEPYYVALTAAETTAVHCAAQDGGLLADDEHHGREGRADVRVGSPQLDSGNTDFTRDYARGISLSDDYDALRRDFWLMTDYRYKRALEALEKRRARRNARPPDEKVPTFAMQPEFRQDPNTTAAAPTSFEVDCTTLVRRLSELPYSVADASVESAEATLWSQSIVRSFVSTEGGVGQTTEGFATLDVVVRGRNDKGEAVVDYVSLAGPTVASLGEDEALDSAVVEMTKRFAAKQNAEPAEPYTGPVLVEGRAAAQLMRELVVPRFLGTPPPEELGSNAGTPPRAIALRVGRRVLPSQFEIYDDPTVATLGAMPLLGHYAFDHEGIATRRVQLVTGGTVKTHLMSRTPTKEIARSTGHGRGLSRIQASPANFVISADGGERRAALERKLLARAKREGLDHAYVVSLLNESVTRGGLGAEDVDFMSALSTNSAVPLDVVVAYRVDRSGKRTPVRNVQMSPPLIRDLRHLVAWGDTPHPDHDPGVRNPGPGYYSPTGFAAPSTVVAPDLLLEEAELLAAPAARNPPAYPLPPRD